MRNIRKRKKLTFPALIVIVLLLLRPATVWVDASHQGAGGLSPLLESLCWSLKSDYGDKLSPALPLGKERFAPIAEARRRCHSAALPRPMLTKLGHHADTLHDESDDYIVSRNDTDTDADTDPEGNTQPANRQPGSNVFLKNNYSKFFD